jgi:hypothetical protein
VGYSIYITDLRTHEGIGNRDTDEIRPIEDFAENESYFDKIEDPNAPSFAGDETTGKSNGRHAAYIGWDRFCKDTGLNTMFFDPESGLMREHPGVFEFNQIHLATVRKTLSAFKKRWPGITPGFAQDDWRYEWSKQEIAAGDLARLIWLEWWMAYAIKNFRHPGIANH